MLGRRPGFFWIPELDVRVGCDRPHWRAQQGQAQADCWGALAACCADSGLWITRGMPVRKRTRSRFFFAAGWQKP